MLNTKVTLSISTDLYHKAEVVAKRRRQSVAQVLAESIRLPDSEPDLDAEGRDEDLEREKQAFLALHPMLVEKYAGEQVAIHQGQLVDHDVDGVALSRRIYAQYPHEFVWIAPVKSQPVEELRFRSPRIG